MLMMGKSIRHVWVKLARTTAGPVSSLVMPSCMLLPDYHFHLLMSRAVLHWQSAIQWLQKRQEESK